MAAGVSASIELNIRAKQTGTADLGTPQITAVLEKILEFTPGTSAVGQANILFSDERTLAASTGEDLDVAGALTDALGATIASAEIVAIAIVAAAANTNDVQVTRPGSNGLAAFLAAGDGVAVGTGDLIHVANSGAGTSVTYQVIVIGRTVAA
jgi:hypothetical protein